MPNLKRNLINAVVDLTTNQVRDKEGVVLGTCTLGKEWNRKNKIGPPTPLKTIYAVIDEIGYMGVMGEGETVRFHVRGYK